MPFSRSQSVQTQNVVVPAASNTTYTSGTVVISGGNNITVGTNGQTITISAFNQTVQTQHLHDVTLAGNSTSAGAGYALVSSGTLTIAGGNNVTLSQNGNAVTISAFNQTVQTQNLVDVTLAGNSTSAGAGYVLASSGTLTLAGGNNITLSQNGNAVTISAANTVAQTVQTQNLHNLTLAGNSTSAGAGYVQVSSGTLTLAGGNNVTLSQNGNAVTISAFNQTVQTQNLHDLTLAGNSTSAGGGYINVSSGTLTLAGGNNVTLSQNGNAITISGPNTVAQSVQTQNLIDVTLAGNSTSAGAGYALASSGTLTLAGGNNITLSQNGNAVTISAFNQTVQTQNLIDVTLAGNSTSAGAGYALASSGTLTLAGGNNITLSQNGNAVTISGPNTVAQSNQAVGGISTQGNTAGTTGLTATNIQFVGSNNVTLSQSTAAGGGATITISGPTTVAQTVQSQNLHNLTLSGNSTSAGAGYIQVSSGTLTLAGGNNITLSQNGNAVTISAFTQTVQTQNLHNVTISGNTSGVLAAISSGTLTLVGGNNITLSQAGNVVTISGPNTAAQSVQTQNLIDVTLAGNSTSAGAGYVLASSGTLTLAGGNNITLSQNGNAVTISAFTQTVQTQNLIDVTLAGNSTSAGGGYVLVSSGTLTLAGGNNITLSQNGNAITISAPNLGAGAGVQIADTAATIPNGTVVFTNANNVSFGLAGSTMSASASFPAQSVQTQSLVVAAAGTQTATSGTVVFSNSNNVTFGMTNSSIITASASFDGLDIQVGGNTIGTTTVASGASSLVLAGGPNITMSGATAAGVASLSISAPTPVTMSFWPDVLPASTAVSSYYSGSTSQGAGGASTQTGYTFSYYLVPLPLPSAVAFSNLRLGVSNTRSTAGTGSVTQMYSIGIYSNNANTLSKVDAYYGGLFFSQNSITAHTFSVFTASTGGNTVGGSGGFAGIAAASVYSSAGNISANSQIDNGLKFIRVDKGAATTLTGGQYWMAFGMCTVSNSSNVLSCVGVLQSNAVSSLVIPDLGRENSTQSSAQFGGWGAISTTFTSVSNAATFFPMPNAINLANLSSSSSAWFRYHLPLMRNI